VSSPPLLTSQISDEGGEEQFHLDEVTAEKMVKFRNWDQSLFVVSTGVLEEEFQDPMDDSSDGSVYLYWHIGEADFVEYTFRGLVLMTRESIGDVSVSDYPHGLVSLIDREDTEGLDGSTMTLVRVVVKQVLEDNTVDMLAFDELVRIPSMDEPPVPGETPDGFTGGTDPVPGETPDGFTGGTDPIDGFAGDPVTVITLEWDDPSLQLEAHLTGPVLGGGDHFHVYHDYPEEPGEALLTRTAGERFQQITIYRYNHDQYRFYVHNFTDRFETSSMSLAQSGARITIQTSGGTRQIAVSTLEDGTLWRLLEIDGNTGWVHFINALSYLEDPAAHAF